MNNLNLAAMALWAGLSMSCSPKTSTVKGIICDATMNTLTIVTEANGHAFFRYGKCRRMGFRPWSKTLSTKDEKLKCGSNRCK